MVGGSNPPRSTSSPVNVVYNTPGATIRYKGRRLNDDELMICAADLIEHQAAEMERLNSIETAWAKMCERLEKEIEWKDKVIELAQREEAEAALKEVQHE